MLLTSDPFGHNSRSDLWGNKCKNPGQFWLQNEYRMRTSDKPVHKSIFSSLPGAENFKTARFEPLVLQMTDVRGLLHLLHAKLVGGTQITTDTIQKVEYLAPLL